MILHIHFIVNFLVAKTENHIRRAATVTVAIPNSAKYASVTYQDHLLKGS